MNKTYVIRKYALQDKYGWYYTENPCHPHGRHWSMDINEAFICDSPSYVKHYQREDTVVKRLNVTIEDIGEYKDEI